MTDDDHEPSYEGITRQQVIDYLKAHPDFLDHNPELFRVLTPPHYHQDTAIVDMQRYMVDKLRDEIDKLQQEFGSLIFSARDNLSAQQQIHQAVLCLLECQTADNLAQAITADLQHIFAIDTVRLCVEVDIAPGREQEYAAIRYVPKGSTNALFAGNQAVVLGSQDTTGIIATIFGAASPLAHSYALCRFTISDNDTGILAFGSRNADQFISGQGTELLSFLSEVTRQIVIRLWADIRAIPENNLSRPSAQENIEHGADAGSE